MRTVALAPHVTRRGLVAVPCEKLDRTLQLGPHQVVTFAQTVGYPRG